MSKRPLRTFLSSSPRIVAVVLLALIAQGCTRSYSAVPDSGAAISRGEQPATAAVTATTPSLPDFSGLVQKYGAAVVNVVSTREVEAPASASRLSPDDPLYDFFRRFGIPAPGGPNGAPNGSPNGSTPGPQLERGEGSGFIISPDGYVLTNAHVVDHASEVNVKLTDRREFNARVVGVDTMSDVAVLKIDAHDLPTVKIGDSSKLRAGQWVAAIGAPFGFENSVTAGVVSATSRAVGAESSIVPFIQTDVAVNPGNSGGPLFDLSGEVVGINSMIYSGTGGYQGISFAIPIDVALDVERQLVKTGHITRGRIGVMIQDVNAELAQSFGLDRPRGALVSAVEKNGPAAKAGLQPGDVIVGVNNKDIERSSELPAIVAHLRPGTTATLEVIRGREEQRIPVRVAELKQPREQMLTQHGDKESTNAPRMGVDVRPLTPEERNQVQLPGGLVVEQVRDPAATAGLEPGDIILRVGSEPVNSVHALQEALRGAKGSVALLIQREDAQLYVPVRLG